MLPLFYLLCLFFPKTEQSPDLYLWLPPSAYKGPYAPWLLVALTCSLNKCLFLFISDQLSLATSSSSPLLPSALPFLFFGCQVPRQEAYGGRMMFGALALQRLYPYTSKIWTSIQEPSSWGTLHLFPAVPWEDGQWCYDNILSGSVGRSKQGHFPWCWVQFGHPAGIPWGASTCQALGSMTLSPLCVLPLKKDRIPTGKAALSKTWD